MVGEKAQSFLEYAFLWAIIAVALSGMWIYMRNSVTAKAEDMRQDVDLSFRSHEETTPFGYEHADANVVNWQEVVNNVNRNILSRYEGRIDSLPPGIDIDSFHNIMDNSISVDSEDKN